MRDWVTMLSYAPPRERPCRNRDSWCGWAGAPGRCWGWYGALGPAEPGMVLKPVQAVLEGIAPLDESWRQLVQFAAPVLPAQAGQMACRCCHPS